MQIQSITFQGNNPKRGVRHIGQLMNRLYDSAYRSGNPSDIIQVSAKMSDGVEVTGVATFDRGHFVNLAFPYEHAHYFEEHKQIFFLFHHFLLLFLLFVLEIHHS